MFLRGVHWRGKYTKSLDEATKRLSERKHELYEIEMKRYKLQQEKGERADALFEALAAEGLLTDEIIDKYKDMKKAEGKRLKEQVGFANAMEDFSVSEQDSITDWIEAYVDAGGDIDAANAAMGYSLWDVAGMTGNLYNQFVEYASSVHLAESAVDGFTDVSETFTEDLVENGLASSNLAGALEEVKTATYDIDHLFDTFNKKLQELATQGMQDVISQSAKMWIGLGGFPEMDMQEWSLKDAMKWDVTGGETRQEFMVEAGGVSAFTESLLKINQETGYFTDKSASAEEVLEAYISFMSTQGVSAMDAFSSEMATAAIAYKHLERAGYDNSEILAIAGGKFEYLGQMGRSALEDIEYDAAGAKDKIDEVKDSVGELLTQLAYLSEEAFYVDIIYKLIEETEANAKKDQIKPEEVGATIADFFLKSLGPIGWAASEGVGRLFDALNIETYGAGRFGPLGPRVSGGEEGGTQEFMYALEEGGVAVGNQIGENATTTMTTGLNPIIASLLTSTPLLTQAGQTIGDGANIVGIEVGNLGIGTSNLTDGVNTATTNIVDSSSTFGSDVTVSGKSFRTMIIASSMLASLQLIKVANAAGLAAQRANSAASKANRAASKSGGILGLLGFSGGGIVNKPTMGVFGEAGAEALIPLEGKNKKFGMKILETIIPEFYPNLMKSEGGIFSTTSSRNVTHTTGDNLSENYNITGPINVTSQDPVDFLNMLKQQYRASR